MPAGQQGMRIAAAADGGRSLQRRRSRLLVQRCGAASEAAGNPAEAEAADHLGRAAGAVPTGSQRAVIVAGFAAPWTPISARWKWLGSRAPASQGRGLP